MPTESPVAPPSAPTIQPDDPDPPDDENSYVLIEAVAKRLSGPLRLRLSPDFARLQGSNILLAMGVVLFLLGCGAFVIGNTTVAAFFVPLGLLAVVVATRMGQLVMLKIGGAIARFVENDSSDDKPGTDGAP
jgi:hypothetical protein